MLTTAAPTSNSAAPCATFCGNSSLLPLPLLPPQAASTLASSTQPVHLANVFKLLPYFLGESGNGFFGRSPRRSMSIGASNLTGSDSGDGSAEGRQAAGADLALQLAGGHAEPALHGPAQGRAVGVAEVLGDRLQRGLPLREPAQQPLSAARLHQRGEAGALGREPPHHGAPRHAELGRNALELIVLRRAHAEQLLHARGRRAGPALMPLRLFAGMPGELVLMRRSRAQDGVCQG